MAHLKGSIYIVDLIKVFCTKITFLVTFILLINERKKGHLKAFCGLYLTEGGTIFNGSPLKRAVRGFP